MEPQFVKPAPTNKPKLCLNCNFSKTKKYRGCIDHHNKPDYNCRSCYAIRRVQTHHMEGLLVRKPEGQRPSYAFFCKDCLGGDLTNPIVPHIPNKMYAF